MPPLAILLGYRRLSSVLGVSAGIVQTTAASAMWALKAGE